MNPIIFISVCLALVAATVIDLRSQRIPNALTNPLAISASAPQTLTQGSSGLWASMLGLGLGLGLMLAPFLFSVMGGGDVKLMAAIGAWVGPQLILTSFLATSIIGGLYALLVLARRGDVIRSVFLRFWTTVSVGAGTGEFHYQPVTESRSLPRLCYGLAIALGTLAAMSRSVLLSGWLDLAR